MLQPNSELEIIKTSPPPPPPHHQQAQCPTTLGLPMPNLGNMVTLEPIPGTSLPPKSSTISQNSNNNRNSPQPQPPHLLQRKSNEAGVGNCYLIPNKPELTVTLVGGSGNGQRKSPIVDTPEISLSIEPVKEPDEDEEPTESKELILADDDDEIKSLSPSSVSDEPKKKRQKTTITPHLTPTPVSLPLAPSNYRTRTVSKAAIAAAAAAANLAIAQARETSPTSSLSTQMPQKQSAIIASNPPASAGSGLSQASAIKPSRIGAGRPRKQLTTAEQLEQLKKKDGIIDIETPGSVLTLVSNLKSVVNKYSFSLLPGNCQENLIKLLPDSIPNRDGSLTLNPSAFENEFFAKALEVWKAKLIAGELTKEHKLKLKQEAEKRKLELDSWKIKNFQPIWGKKNNAQTRNSAAVATTNCVAKQSTTTLSPLPTLSVREGPSTSSTLRTSPRLSSNSNTIVPAVSIPSIHASQDTYNSSSLPPPCIKEETEPKPPKPVLPPVKHSPIPKTQSPPPLLLSPGKRDSDHLNIISDGCYQGIAAKKIRIIPPLHPSVSTSRVETEIKNEPKSSDNISVPFSEASTNQPVIEFVPSADEDDTLLLCTSNEIPLVEVDQADCSVVSKPKISHEMPTKVQSEQLPLSPAKKIITEVSKETVTAAQVVPVTSVAPTISLSLTSASNVPVLSTPPPLQISSTLASTFQRLPIPIPLQMPQQITLAATTPTRPQRPGTFIRSPQQVMLRMVTVPPPSGQSGDGKLKLVHTIPFSQPITTSSATPTNQVSVMIKVSQPSSSSAGTGSGTTMTTSCISQPPQPTPVLSIETKSTGTNSVLIPITTNKFQFQQAQGVPVTQSPVQIQLTQTGTKSGLAPVAVRNTSVQQIVSVQKPIRPLLLPSPVSQSASPTPLVTRPLVPTNPVTVQTTASASSQSQITPTITTTASVPPIKKHAITNRPKVIKKLSSVPPGSINLERSYQICQAVIQSSSNRDKLQKHLVKPLPVPNNSKKEGTPSQIQQTQQQVQPQSQTPMVQVPSFIQNQVKVSEPPKMIHINRKPSTPTLTQTSGMPTMQLLNGISGQAAPPQQKLIVVSGPQGQSLQMMPAQHQNQSLIRPGSPVIQLGNPGGLGNLVVSPDNSHPQHPQPAPLDPCMSMSVGLGTRFTGTNTTTSTTASTFKHHGNGNALNLNVLNHKLYKPNNLHQQSQSTAIGMSNNSAPIVAPHQSMTTATVITQEQLAMLLQKRRQQTQSAANMNVNTRFMNSIPNSSTYLNLNPSSPNNSSLLSGGKVVLRNGSSPQPPPVGNMTQAPTGRHIRIIRAPIPQQRLPTQQQFLRVPVSKSELANGNTTGYPIRAQFVTRNGETFLIRTPVRLPANPNPQHPTNMNLRPPLRMLHRTNLPESQNEPSSPRQNPGSPQGFAYGNAPERSPVSNLAEFINNQMANMRSISPLAMEEGGGRVSNSPNSMNTLVHSPQRDQGQGGRSFVLRQHHQQQMLPEEIIEFHQQFDSSVPIDLEAGEHLEWFNGASTTTHSPSTFPPSQPQTNLSQVSFLTPSNESPVQRHGQARSPMIQSVPGQPVVPNSSTPRPTNSNPLTHHLTNNTSNESNILVQSQTPQNIESQTTIQHQQQPQQFIIVQTPGVNGVVQNIAVPASFVLSPQVILDQQKGNAGATTVLNTGNQNQIRFQQIQGPPRASSAPPTNNINQTGTMILNSVSGQVQHQQQFAMAPPPTSQFSGDNSSGIRILYSSPTTSMQITNQTQPPSSTYCIAPSAHSNVVQVHQSQTQNNNMNILQQSHTHQTNTTVQQQILNVENQAAWISEQLNGVSGGHGPVGIPTPGTTIVDVNLNGSNASAQIIPGQHPVISIPDPGGSSNGTGAGSSGSINTTGQNGNGITFSGQDFDIFLANVTGSGIGTSGPNGESVNINLNENNSVSVTFPVSMGASKGMKSEQILLAPPTHKQTHGHSSENSLQNGNCICDLRALIMCKKCGAFCQRDCMSTGDHCMTCA